MEWTHEFRLGRYRRLLIGVQTGERSAFDVRRSGPALSLYAKLGPLWLAYVSLPNARG